MKMKYVLGFLLFCTYGFFFKKKESNKIQSNLNEVFTWLINFICSETCRRRWLPGGQTNFYFLYW